jgi:hypothetical protein
MQKVVGPSPIIRSNEKPRSGGVFCASDLKFNTDAKIIAVIRSGSVIGRAPIVSMPHWSGIIPPAQLNDLVAYIKTLKAG